MAYRSGTYFAFDALGQTNPAKSDFRYYATVQGWDRSEKLEFKFVNSHDKASAVRDKSKLTTLQASIHKRLASSKNMVVIISADTRKEGSLLSWEIEEAVDRYELPLILAYTGCDAMLNPSAMSDRWPKTLKKRIDDRSAQAIHIPFKRDAMFNAIGRFTVNGEDIGGSLIYYSEEAHRSWGYIR